MSGRGRGRSNNRGRQSSGRGRDVNRNNNNGNKNNNHKPSKIMLGENIYYRGSAKQAADYETTTEFLINHIKKNFNFGTLVILLTACYWPKGCLKWF